MTQTHCHYWGMLSNDNGHGLNTNIGADIKDYEHGHKPRAVDIPNVLQGYCHYYSEMIMGTDIKRTLARTTEIMSGQKTKAIDCDSVTKSPERAKKWLFVTSGDARSPRSSTLMYTN
jgi:hypothetical protein